MKKAVKKVKRKKHVAKIAPKASEGFILIRGKEIPIGATEDDFDTSEEFEEYRRHMRVYNHNQHHQERAALSSVEEEEKE